MSSSIDSLTVRQEREAASRQRLGVSASFNNLHRAISLHPSSVQEKSELISTMRELRTAWRKKQSDEIGTHLTNFLSRFLVLDPSFTTEQLLNIKTILKARLVQLTPNSGILEIDGQLSPEDQLAALNKMRLELEFKC